MSQILIAIEGDKYFLANDDINEFYDKVQHASEIEKNTILVFGRFVEKDENSYCDGLHSSALIMVDKILGWRNIN